MAKIYLAGGWFNTKQEERIAVAEKTLRALGHEVFSPRENQHEEHVFGTEAWRIATFNGDIDAIDWADVIFAIYDEEDAGTMMEVGYAYATDTTIILFNESEKVVNLMLSDSCFAYLQKWSDVEEYDFNEPVRVPFDGEVL